MARHAEKAPAEARDPKMLALMGAGALALVALLFFVVMPMLTGGGSSSSTGSTGAASLPRPRVVPKATPTPRPPAAAGPGVIDAGDATRNPFAPLPQEASAAAAAASTTSGSTTTTSSTGSSGATGSTGKTSGSTGTASGSGSSSSVPAATPTTGTSTTPSAASSPAATSITVRLLAVEGAKARMEIGGKDVTVKVGDKVQGFTINKISLDGVLLDYKGAEAALAPGESQNF